MSFATTIDLTQVGIALKDAGVTNVTARHHGLLVTSPLINQSTKPSTKTRIRCNSHMVYELFHFLINDIIYRCSRPIGNRREQARRGKLYGRGE